jgi:hypothetical protein
MDTQEFPVKTPALVSMAIDNLSITDCFLKKEIKKECSTPHHQQ